MHDLGAILKNLRNQHGYTQNEVAKKLNISTVSISRWEQNTKKPTIERLIELAILYNVSINELIGVPIEDSLVIDNLSTVQQELIQKIAYEFYSSPPKRAGKISSQQQNLINMLIQEFSN